MKACSVGLVYFLVIFCPASLSLKWQDEDTIVIQAEASPSEKSSSNSARSKRQFFLQIVNPQFSLDPEPYPYQEVVQSPEYLYSYDTSYSNGFEPYYQVQSQSQQYQNKFQNHQNYGPIYAQQSKSPARCYTTNKEIGVCARLSDCYPVLYTMDSYRGERNITNNPLAEDLLFSSGPCSNNPEDIRNNIVCCPTFRQNRYPSKPANTPSAKEVPTPPNCGQSLTKVVNGQEAKRGQNPWIVALMNGNRQFCGGSLIDDYHVITAAHCVSHMNGNQVQNLRLYLGAHDLYSALESGRVVARVSSVRYHRGFSHQTLLNDIAILRMSTPVRYWNYNNINAICLTTGKPPYDVGYPWVRLAGWGQLRYKGPQASRLQHVDLQVWPNDVCARRLGRIPPAGLQPHMVCASGSGGRDACNGDSGGPLMRWMNNRVEQIGIVSWGVNCGLFPGVYTRVDHFISWLNKNRLS